MSSIDRLISTFIELDSLSLFIAQQVHPASASELMPIDYLHWPAAN
jgi:hypothetical protein